METQRWPGCSGASRKPPLPVFSEPLVKLGSHRLPTGLRHPALEWGQSADGSQGLGVLWVLFTLGAIKGRQGHFL